MNIIARGLIAAFSVLFLASAATGSDLDWKRASWTKVVLFYPGTASWEFARSRDHRPGSRAVVRMKRGCRYCHLGEDGELDLKADEIATGSLRMKRSGRPFEPVPQKGKKGFITARLKALYDERYIYILVEWPSAGRGWKGGDKGGGRDVEPDRVNLQINAAEPSFKKYGCFITCHDDLHTMPAEPPEQEVRKNPYYRALGRDDVRLYAFYARRSWKGPVQAGKLEKMLGTGRLVDLWSAELKDGGIKALDGWILDDRRWEKRSDIEASGGWQKGLYRVVFKRKLSTGDIRDVAIKPGGRFFVGLSIHDDNAEDRFHYVSFPFSIGLGKKADLRAVRLGPGPKVP